MNARIGCEAPVGSHVWNREQVAELRLYFEQEHPCKDRAGVRRRKHVYDRDGVCIYCDRLEKRDGRRKFRSARPLQREA